MMKQGQCKRDKGRVFRQIFLLFQPVKPLLPVYGLAMIMVGSRNLIINYLTAFLESSVAEAAIRGKGEELLYSSLCFLAGVLLFVIFDTFGLWLHGVTTHRMTSLLKEKIHRQVLYGELSAFAHIEGGKSEVLTRLNQDVNTAKEIYGNLLLLPLMYLISGIGASVSICIRSLSIGLVLILVGTAGMLFQWKLGKRQRKVSRRLQQVLGGITSVVNDLQVHGPAIRFADLTAAFQRRLTRYLGDFERAGKEDACIQARLGAVGSTLYFFQYMGTILLAIFEMSRGKIGVGDLFFIVQMSSLLLTAFSVIGSTVVSLQRALAGAERIEELLTLPQEKGGGVRTFLPAPNVLETEGTVCRFSEDSRLQLQGPIRIPSGKITVIRGESGKGKSTLLKLMLRLYPYEEGSVKLWGTELSAYDLTFLRRQIAYVQQPPFIIAGTIEENLLLDCGRNPDKEKDKEEIRQAMEISGVTEWLTGFPDREKTVLREGGAPLSGGQRQTLVIARALLKDCPLILLDESFSNMDVLHTDKVLAGIGNCGRDLTVILVSHDRQAAKQAQTLVEL